MVFSFLSRRVLDHPPYLLLESHYRLSDIMKFRGGILGFRSSGKTPVVEETAKSTGKDAEAGLKTTATANVNSPDTPVSPDRGWTLDEKTQDPAERGSPSSEEDEPIKQLQYGVQLAEATLKVWTRKDLVTAYAL